MLQLKINEPNVRFFALINVFTKFIFSNWNLKAKVTHKELGYS